MKNLIRISLLLITYFYGLSFATAGMTCKADGRDIVVINYAPAKELHCMNVWLAKLESYGLTCDVTFDGKFYRGRGIKFGRAFTASVNIETSETKIQNKKIKAHCTP